MTAPPSESSAMRALRNTTDGTAAIAYMRAANYAPRELIRLCEEAGVRPARSLAVTFGRIALSIHPTRPCREEEARS